MSLSFAVLLLGYVLSQFYRAFLAVIAHDLTRELGLGPGALGNISAIWFAAFALAQFPVGVALDRLGPRRTMAVFFWSLLRGLCCLHGPALILKPLLLWRSLALAVRPY